MVVSILAEYLLEALDVLRCDVGGGELRGEALQRAAHPVELGEFSPTDRSGTAIERFGCMDQEPLGDQPLQGPRANRRGRYAVVLGDGADDQRLSRTKRRRR